MLYLYDPISFPPSNAETAGATASTAIETSDNYPYGCTAVSGNFISIVCDEAAPAAQATATTADAGQIYTLEQETEIPKSYIELDVTVPEFLRYISFDYSFSNIGDGDYVYIFLDGDIIWKMSSDAVTQDEVVASGLVPLRAEPGNKKLIIALYGVGEQNPIQHEQLQIYHGCGYRRRWLRGR